MSYLEFRNKINAFLHLGILIRVTSYIAYS